MILKKKRAILIKLALSRVLLRNNLLISEMCIGKPRRVQIQKRTKKEDKKVMRR